MITFRLWGIFIAVFATLSICEEEPKKFFLELSGMAGYYYLPENIKGNIDNYYYYNGVRPAYLEASSSSSGYTQQSYHYEHPFAKENRKNVGIRFQATYFYNSYFGAGFDYSHTFSLFDYTADHVYTDTSRFSVYSYYNPIDSASRYDYQVKSITSHDQLYMKQSIACVAIAFRKAVRPKLNLHLRLSLGLADYLQVFRIEYTNIVARYYRNGIGEVYSEIISPYFDTFGINYSAFCICPKISLEKPLTAQISLCAGAEFPGSYIEKGNEWHENNSGSGGIYYPETRFFASDPAFTLGLGVNF